MNTAMLTHSNSAKVDKATIETFRREFHGQALLPGEAGYDSARRNWNASLDKHPGLIARCLDEDTVVRALKFARRTIFSSRSKAAATTSPAGPCATMALSSASRR
jgi:hypothetical protein